MLRDTLYREAKHIFVIDKKGRYAGNILKT